MKKLLTLFFVLGLAFSYNVNAMDSDDEASSSEESGSCQEEVKPGAIKRLVKRISSCCRKDGATVDVKKVEEEDIKKLLEEERFVKLWWGKLFSIPCKLMNFLFRTKKGFAIVVGGVAIIVTYINYPEAVSPESSAEFLTWLNSIAEQLISSLVVYFQLQKLQKLRIL